MKTILTAVALTIALPAVAHAQSAPTPAPKAECCKQMKDCKCCKDMDESHVRHDGKGEAGSHAGHNMPEHDAKSPQPSQQHQH